MLRRALFIGLLSFFTVLAVASPAMAVSPYDKPIIEGPVKHTAISEQGSLVSMWCVAVSDLNGDAIRMTYRATQGSIMRSTRQGRLRCVWHILPIEAVQNVSPTQRYYYTIVATATDSQGLTARLPLRELVVRIARVAS